MARKLRESLSKDHKRLAVKESISLTLRLLKTLTEFPRRSIEPTDQDLDEAGVESPSASSSPLVETIRAEQKAELRRLHEADNLAKQA